MQCKQEVKAKTVGNTVTTGAQHRSKITNAERAFCLFCAWICAYSVTEASADAKDVFKSSSQGKLFLGNAQQGRETLGALCFSAISALISETLVHRQSDVGLTLLSVGDQSSRWLANSVRDFKGLKPAHLCSDHSCGPGPGKHRLP